MAKEKSVAVFCAASENIDKLYVDAAHEVGTMLGRIGVSLVYGGARFGLMEATAKSAKEAGAHVVGVVPDILVERGRVSTLLDEQISCRNLSERKDIMLEKSDIHNKRVVLYNVNGFWDSLLETLDKYNASGFIRGEITRFMLVADNIEELEKLIEGAVE